MSLAGAIADARKSATRMYINNFADKGRQNTIDMLLVCHASLAWDTHPLINDRDVWSINRPSISLIRSTISSMLSSREGKP